MNVFYNFFYLILSAATKDVTMEMMKDDHTVKVTFPEGIDGEFEFKIPTTNGVKTKVGLEET